MIEIVASRNEACRFRNVNSRDRFSEPNDDSAIFEIAATFFAYVTDPFFSS